MKKIFLTLLLVILLSIKGFCQEFISDSVCYYNSTTRERIRCDTPYPDPTISSILRDIWEIKRDGDFIKITHWNRKALDGEYGVGLITNFRVESKNEEETSYPFPNKKIKQSSQYLEGIASSTRVYRLSLVWYLYDLNDDGIWDRLAVRWLESNTPLERVIFCHFI